MTFREDTSLLRAWWRWMRIIAIAGVPVGMVIAGIGSRTAMFVLRLTSPDTVRGVESDDGFTIGQFDIGDSYGFVQFGALVGVIGAVMYLLVRPWLIGPRWFRYVTVGLGSGAVVGSMLLHADGVDFRVLEPKWLAMTLFIVIPFLFGCAIGPAVEWIERRPVPAGWRQFVLPVAVLALGPGGLFALGFAAAPMFFYAVWRMSADVERFQAPPPVRLVVRMGWLAIAMLGLVALVNDVRAISALS